MKKLPQAVRARLLLVALVGEVLEQLEVHGPGLAGRAVLALVVEHADRRRPPRPGRPSPGARAIPAASPACRRPRSRRSTRRSPGPTTRACGASPRPGRARRRAARSSATSSRSGGASSSGSSSRRWNWVGTMCVVVTRCCSIAASARSGSQRSISTTVCSKWSENQLKASGAVWYIGDVHRCTPSPPGVMPKRPRWPAWRPAIASGSIGIRSRLMPLGLPGGARGVLHELSGAAIRRERGGLRALERLVGGEARQLAHRDPRRRRQPRLVGGGHARARPRRASATKALAPESRRMCAISGGARLVLSGVMYQPACIAASSTSSAGAAFGSSMATTSPRASPRARSACTSWWLAPASSSRGEDPAARLDQRRPGGIRQRRLPEASNRHAFSLPAI